MFRPLVESLNELQLSVMTFQCLYPATLIITLRNAYVNMYLPTSFTPITIYDPTIRSKYVPTPQFNRVSSTSASDIYDNIIEVCTMKKDEHVLFNLLKFHNMDTREIRSLVENFGH